MTPRIEAPVARRKPTRPAQPAAHLPAAETPKTTTKVAIDLMQKARLVAGFRNIDIFDYIDLLLRPLITSDYREELERAHSQKD